MSNHGISKRIKLDQAVLIYSVEMSSLPKHENDNRTEIELQELSDSGVPYTEIMGSYRGVPESSILVPHIYESLVQISCSDWNQETYLYVERSGLATLMDPRTGRPVTRLGYLYELPSGTDLTKLEAYYIIDGIVYSTKDY
jgi:hypothetical protein